MLLEVNRSLYGALDSPAATTHKGMAHFAGTGPAGATCGQCEFWQIIGEKARAHVCAKARSLGIKSGLAIPAEACSCKYYERRAPAK